MKMGLEVSCDKCDTKISVDSATIEKRKRVYAIELKDGTKVDEMIYISYFDCPKCGCRYIFLVEDFEQIKLMKSRDSALFKANKYRKNKLPIPKNVMLKINQLTREINIKNTQLVERYADALYKTSLFLPDVEKLNYYGGDPQKVSVSTLEGEENK